MRALLVGCVVVALVACGSSGGGTSQKAAARLKAHQVKAGWFTSTSLPFDPSSRRPKLQFEGDSITHLSAGPLYEHFRSRYNVAIHAQVGVSTYQEVPNTTGAQAELNPRVEVVNLGTNDADRLDEPATTSQTQSPLQPPPQTVSQVLGRFTQLAGQFGPSTCLVFVTVNTHNPSWGPAQARAINRHLREIAASRPRTVIADWNAAWQKGYFNRSDNPHPNARGREALVTLVDRAVAQCGR